MHQLVIGTSIVLVMVMVVVVTVCMAEQSISPAAAELITSNLVLVVMVLLGGLPPSLSPAKHSFHFSQLSFQPSSSLTRLSFKECKLGCWCSLRALILLPVSFLVFVQGNQWLCVWCGGALFSFSGEAR